MNSLNKLSMQPEPSKPTPEELEEAGRAGAIHMRLMAQEKIWEERQRKGKEVADEANRKAHDCAQAT